MTMRRVRRLGEKLLAAMFVLLGGLGLAGLATADGGVDGGVDGGSEADAGARPGWEPRSGTGTGKVAVIRVDGAILGGAEEYVVRSIERAEREGHAALVVELDTPGGGLEDTEDIVKRMLSARVPVVVFVAPKGAQAASAGTFITMAGHVAVMSPGTRIGAAHPVMMNFMPSLPGDGDKKEDEEQKKRRETQEDIMNMKVTNDTVAFATSIAKERGRNAEWAEKAVRDAVSITADEAVTLDVVDFLAEDLQDLLDKLEGREVRLDTRTTTTLHTKGAAVERWAPTLKQRLLSGLANPDLLWLLFLIGLGGLAMEFYHPGMIFPGVVGGLCLLLALVSMQILPINVGGLLLVLVGIGLFVAEVLVGAFGLLAVGGAVLLVLGGILLVDPADAPHYMDPTMQVDLSVLIPTALLLGLLFVGIGYFIVRSQRRKIRTGSEGMVGDVGEARTDIGPQGGRAFVHGEWWAAISAEPIPKGSKIEIVRVDGLVAHVKLKN
ncbi:MAG TPA: nodulation protein NfeD [Myxococcota bacterium]|nr:nodulation protein NfeD [Myxococcota bacterium]HRY92049.1 nodulation protein NfeD [Myxococcota bacterium]HSA24040.1 nodulation protein NfeD [Myxococcota bacterium]